MSPPNVLEAVQEAQSEWRLGDYLRFARQHWLWLAFCGITGALVAWILVSQIPSAYESRARILIDRYTAEPVRFAENLPAAASLRDVEFLATEYQLMTSRPVVEQVLRELNLTGFPPFSSSPDPVATLTGMLRVSAVRGTKLADITATSTNPSLAMRIANTTAQVYAQLNLERHRQQTTGGADWLREEVVRTEVQMKAAQEALQRFKEEHQMVSLEDRQNVIVQRLKELSSAGTEAKTARLRAETEQAEIARAVGRGSSPESLPVVRASEIIQGLKKQIGTKEGELADRLKIYGARHPVIVQLQTELETLQGQLAGEAQRVIEAVRLEAEAAQAREQELQQALAEQERLALDLNRLELGYENLNREAKVSADLYDSLSKRLKELEVSESLQTNNVRIVDDAKLPEIPVGPHRRRFIAIGLLLGLVAGGVGAFVREALTTTIRSRKDLEELLSLPFLGRVLRVELPRSRRGHRSLFFVEKPNGVAAEGVRAIRTTLEFLLPEAPTHRLVVSSSLPEEGKSLVSANLAIAFQEMGRRVVLIDADMRRPTIFRTFQVPLEPGLSTYLQGQATLEDILQPSKAAPGLTVIASGAVPPRPADLLASPAMATLLDELSAAFQYLVMDTPPILAVADAAILSRLVDGAILVVRSHQTTKEVALAARQQLGQTPLKFLGTLLNDVKPGSEYGYRYHYGYYGEGRKPRRRKPWEPAADPAPPPPDAAAAGGQG